MKIKVLLSAFCVLQIAAAATIKETWDEAVEEAKKKVSNSEKALAELKTTEINKISNIQNVMDDKQIDVIKAVTEKIVKLNKKADDYYDQAHKQGKYITLCLLKEQEDLFNLNLIKSLEGCYSEISENMSKLEEYFRTLLKYMKPYELIVPTCLEQVKQGEVTALKECVSLKSEDVLKGILATSDSINKESSIAENIGNTCIKEVGVVKSHSVDVIDENLTACVKEILH